MTTHFETASGAHYELANDLSAVRRIEGASGNTKRRDGDWLRLLTLFPKTPRVGFCVSLVIESLAPHGPDDYGTTHPDPGGTTRLTTPVVRVWGADD